MFVVKVKIIFSHLLKTGLYILQIHSHLSELLFYSRPDKIYSNIYYNTAPNLNYCTWIPKKKLSSLLRKNDNKRKKKDTIMGYYMTNYTILLATAFAIQNGHWIATERSQTATVKGFSFFCKVCLVVNHPDIALTLEKCLFQGINHCLLLFNFFMSYAIFVLIFKLSHIASTKVTKASLWIET